MLALPFRVVSLLITFYDTSLSLLNSARRYLDHRPPFAFGNEGRLGLLALFRECHRFTPHSPSPFSLSLHP